MRLCTTTSNCALTAWKILKRKKFVPTGSCFAAASHNLPWRGENYVWIKSVGRLIQNEMQWIGFRPPLCTYRLNWDRRTSWGWWDDWDDTPPDTGFEIRAWRSKAEHATSRSRRLPTILTFTRGWWRNIFCFFQTTETGNRTPNSGVKGSGANHYPRAPAREVDTRLKRGGLTSLS